MEVDLKGNILFTEYLQTKSSLFFKRLLTFKGQFHSTLVLRGTSTFAPNYLVCHPLPKLTAKVQSYIYSVHLLHGKKPYVTHMRAISEWKTLMERRWDATDLPVEQVAEHGVPLRHRGGRGPVLYAAFLCFSVGHS